MPSYVSVCGTEYIFAQTRMTSLECALHKATVYMHEDWLDKLSRVEAKLLTWEPFTIASQSLKRQLEAIKVCVLQAANFMSCAWL